MQGYLSGAIMANRVLMLRSQHEGSFLLVEGDRDSRLFKRFTDSLKCMVIDAGNKENVVDAIKILEERDLCGVLGIVDADFWNLEKSLPISKNLLITDTHDVETMIIRSTALEKVLSEYGSQKKLSELAKNVRILLLEGGIPLGCLRWISLTRDFSLDFEDLPFSHFVDRDTLVIDVPTLIQVVCNHSSKSGLIEELHAEITQFTSKVHDPWQVCCGYDLISILSIGLRKMLGSRRLQEVEPKQLNRALRLAFETTDFCGTQLYSLIKKWEEENEPFQVLSAS